MVTSAKKNATPVVKTDLALKAKSAKVAKRAASSLGRKSASASPVAKSYAPIPKKKTGNRFTSDAASVLNFAIKAGILTPGKKLTASFK